VNAALRGIGVRELPGDRIVGFVGHGMRRLLVASLGAAAPGREEELLEAATERFREAYGRGLLDRTRLHAGIPELLEELSRRGVRSTLLTNKPRAFTDPILAGLGVAHRFADAVCGDEVSRPKPDPEGLLRLVARSGLPADATCLVGDSAVDVETARRGGVASCAVSWGLRDAAELLAARPDHLVGEASAIARLTSPGPAAPSRG